MPKPPDTAGGSPRWTLMPADDAAVSRLTAEMELLPPVARVLVQRGFSDPETARRFLDPRLADLQDPFELPDMEAAVERVADALRKDRRIVIYGDYDADGVTASAVLAHVLERMGAKSVSVFLPSRFDHGYGVTEAGLRACVEGYRPDLLLTVDCGTNSASLLAPLEAGGLRVVVTDHHDPTECVTVPYPVVNPHRSPLPVTALAGVGVAFKFCHALLKRWHGKAPPAGQDLRAYLDLVAVGTVADVVSLLGENRILVTHGLRRMNDAGAPWLEAIRGVSGLGGRVRPYEIGFIIGPRLNAAGRMGRPEEALRLLMTEDPATLRQAAEALEKANRDRKMAEDRILEAAVRDLSEHARVGVDSGLVVAGAGWHSGVIGIVATRLCDRHGCPVAAISLDAQGGGKGSCRGPVRGDLMALLAACAETLDGYGGHRLAAGFVLKPACLESFRRAFAEHSVALFGAPGTPESVCIDAWIDSLEEINERLFEAVTRLEPFGEGNPAPRWGIRNVRVQGSPTSVGKEGRHTRLSLVQGRCRREAIAFGLEARRCPGPLLDLVFRLRENEYMGKRSIQLQVDDWRVAAGKDA